MTTPNPKGQRGQRQETGNDHSTKKSSNKKSNSGNSSPGREDNDIEKSQREHGA